MPCTRLLELVGESGTHRAQPRLLVPRLLCQSAHRNVLRGAQLLELHCQPLDQLLRPVLRRPLRHTDEVLARACDAEQLRLCLPQPALVRIPLQGFAPTHLGRE